MTNDLSNDGIKILELIKSFIEKDIRTHHTIADLAKQFGTNKDKLKKQFHYYFDMGVFGYLRELRLQKAKTYWNKQTRRKL
jgi:AraC-like DNA-binding protein